MLKTLPFFALYLILSYISIMSSILIAESGSTKTDWHLSSGGKKQMSAKTSGINPYLQTSAEILSLIEKELKYKKKSPDEIYFYGAGLSSPEKQKEIKTVLKKHFNTKKIEVKSDMLAAARGLCGREKGMVAILGTGSNCCFYDGKKTQSNTASLGYVLGDEGSGNHMGKKVINYYAYKTFDEELIIAFEQLYSNDISSILNNIYKQPFPNRYLAGFTNILAENRGHYMVENIIEDSINDFIHQHLLKYRESWKYPIHFTGSIAYIFKDVITSLCDNFGLSVGNIERSPLKGLIKYHSS